MAKNTICSVDGCGKRSNCRGWCEGHYTNWRRHGTPTWIEPLTPIQEFVKVAAACKDDECLLWPFDAYDRSRIRVSVNGKTRNVFRYVCELAHGLPPTPKHEAAHSCGRGDVGCVNGSHLRWDTKIGNQADRYVHGTHLRGDKNWCTKLSENDVREVRKLIAAGLSQTQISIKLSVNRNTVKNISTGRTWAWLDTPIEERNDVRNRRNR